MVPTTLTYHELTEAWSSVSIVGCSYAMSDAAAAMCRTVLVVASIPVKMILVDRNKHRKSGKNPWAQACVHIHGMDDPAKGKHAGLLSLQSTSSV